MAPTPAERLEAALHYADLGWALIPLGPGSKEPFADLLPRDREGKPRWKPLAQRAATKAEIRKWLEYEPELNLGMITGEASRGMIVMDFDRRPPPLPVTPIVETSRGLHAYFRAEQPVPTRKFPGGELRGDGAYVVVPPSLHPTGGYYRWADFLSPRDADPISLPDRLAALIYPEKAPLALVESSEARNDIVSRFTASSGEARGRLGELERLAGCYEVAAAVAERCGCKPKELGKTFLCPLPGHDEKRRRPSAALWQKPNGLIMLRCFHEHDWWPLPDLFAATVTQEYRRLKKGERAAWWLRALYEVGAVSPPRIAAAPLPPDTPPEAPKAV